MKQYLINICYKEKHNKQDPIKEMQLVAHSIRDAIAAFALWQQNVYPKNMENGSKTRYVVVAATKLEEIQGTESQKAWMRLHPERTKSQIYVCPYCQETCQAPSIGCNYRFCPRCGREVKVK